MDKRDSQKPSGFIRWSRLCEALDCDTVSLERYCERFDIPVTVFSKRKRGLTVENYALLLERATGGEAHA